MITFFSMVLAAAFNSSILLLKKTVFSLAKEGGEMYVVITVSCTFLNLRSKKPWCNLARFLMC